MPRWPIARVVAALTGFVVAGTIGLISTSYGKEISKARQRVASGSRIAQTKCGPIEYAEAGSGPAVLMVHGAGGGYDQGLDFAAPLGRKGFRIIAMSRFGYLRTPLPVDASAEAQADAHACLLDALNIPKAAIIGGSAGAPSAMQFAIRHPERTRALVIAVPAAYVPRPNDAPPMKTPAGTEFMFKTALRFDFVYWTATRIARPTIIRSLLATPVEDVERASPLEQARVATLIEHIMPVSSRRLGMINDAAITSMLPRYDLEKITVPTLAISVKDDQFGTFDGAKYTAENVRGAQFIGYETGGHIWAGHADEINSAIAAFLK
jgi:pimeloyl-ACP methyl ester carboxylesterase